VAAGTWGRCALVVLCVAARRLTIVGAGRDGATSLEGKVTIRLAQPRSEQDWRQARRLIEEYAASLSVDLSFQNFAHELEHLASEYAPVTGVLLLAEERGVYLGCVGVRQFSDGIGEIKRLYVIPVARGRGVGRLLAEGIVAAAKQLGYTRLLLDTLPSMKEAQSLYVSLRFKPTAAYRFNPVPGTAFLELDLR
jgi:GNAT superfamily N-acetyltransferase